jgi:thiol-disulfide isomerase/thioredoxin/YHS domain-containing protein
MRTIHYWSWAVVAVLGCSALAAADEVRWQSDLDSARRLAAQNNRLILVHCWAPWCPPCRRLEQNVFQQPGVGPALEANFVLVKLNLDEHPEMQQQFNIHTIPCDLILTPQGRVVDKVQSKQTAQEYVHQMTQVAAIAMGHSGSIAARQSGDALLVSQTSTQPAPSAGYCQVSPAAQPVSAGPLASSQTPAVYQQSQPQSAAQGQGAGGQELVQNTPQHGDYWSRQAAANPLGNIRPQLEVAQNKPASSLQPSLNPMTQPSPTAYTSPYAGISSPAPSAVVAPAVSSASARPTVQQAQSTLQQPAQNVAAQPKLPPMGLDGFCPVSLCESELWSKGDPRWGVIHRGRLYLFAGPEQQQRFWANPDHYSPVAAGHDPVLALDHGQTIEGRREHGVFFEGRIYLFASEASLQRFSQSPQRYASEITQAMNRR